MSLETKILVDGIVFGVCVLITILATIAQLLMRNHLNRHYHWGEVHSDSWFKTFKRYIFMYVALCFLVGSIVFLIRLITDVT